jgi:hypothetical protein
MLSKHGRTFAQVKGIVQVPRSVAPIQHRLSLSVTLPPQAFEQRFSCPPRNNFAESRDLIISPFSDANGVKRNRNNGIEWLGGDSPVGEGDPKPVSDGFSKMKLSIVFQAMDQFADSAPR